MSVIRILDGFSGVEQGAHPCTDGQGSIRVYPLFDGVKALLLQLKNVPNGMALRSIFA